MIRDRWEEGSSSSFTISIESAAAFSFHFLLSFCAHPFFFPWSFIQLQWFLPWPFAAAASKVAAIWRACGISWRERVSRKKERKRQGQQFSDLNSQEKKSSYYYYVYDTPKDETYGGKKRVEIASSSQLLLLLLSLLQFSPWHQFLKVACMQQKARHNYSQ